MVNLGKATVRTSMHF